MVCEYILGWRNAASYLKVYVTLTLTLTFDLNHQHQHFPCPTLLQLGSSNMCEYMYIRIWLSGTYYFKGQCDFDLGL